MTRSYTVRFLGILCVLSVLAGCTTHQSQIGSKTAIGGLGGAAVGSLLTASQSQNPLAIAGGTLLGFLTGAAVGNRLDAADQQHATRAVNQALEAAPTGQAVPWRNPDSGHTGTFTPTRTYQSTQGQICREYQHVVLIGGREERAHGTACRQLDGSWKVL
jgi:surface antigen